MDSIQIEEKLEQLSKLTQDWDSYGADPPTPISIEVARHVLREFDTIFVAPTNKGGIGFELDFDEDRWIMIEIRADGKIEMGSGGIYLEDDSIQQAGIDNLIY